MLGVKIITKARMQALLKKRLEEKGKPMPKELPNAVAILNCIYVSHRFAEMEWIPKLIKKNSDLPEGTVRI